MSVTRRTILAGAAAGTATLAFPNVVLGKGEPIRVGTIPPITGPQALNGEEEVEGAQYAAEEINSRPGKCFDDRPIELVIEDATSDNQAAVGALNKLLGENVVAVVQPVLSTQIQAMAPVMQKAGLPWMTGGTAVKNTQLGLRNLFRCRASDAITAHGLVDFAVKEKGLKKIGILHASEAFGVGGADQVETALKTYNLKAVAREGFPANTKDFTPELLKIKSAGAEAIIAYVQNPSDSAVILDQYKSLNLTSIAFIGSPAVGNPTALNTAKTAADGIYVAQDFIIGFNSNVATKFITNFYRKYHKQPDVGTGQGWTRDAFLLLADTYKRIGTTDPAKTVEALHQTKHWEGVLGDFTCDTEGNLVHNMSIGLVKSSKVSLVKTVKVTV
ncbi:MAG: ABC transporter substrate-binding protein [Candidatus Eremiobacteraeota bacterium]|nr:ABC transporter substrate-binding protein [Candidatus Eremiobacteraeota bacterium]